MIKPTRAIECADCGTEIDGRSDTTGHRVYCAKCGSSKRNYHVSISEAVVARDGIGLKARRAGDKKLYIEDLAVPDYSRRLEKLVPRHRVIDRDNDRYFERVTDYESGEVIHHCEKPLTQHQRHGDAKPKKGDANG